MKKKIVLIFVALFIFYMPLSITHQEVNAVAVASKVVNASAKKVAKEVAVDTAVQMSMNMVIDYKYTPKDNKQPKDGYSFICMPRDKKADGGCNNAVQVKETLTDTDRQQLSNRIETNLERKVAGGIGASKFGKFLDWFVPIFSIGMGVAVIDYAMHGDVSDLFDELAWDTMAELGMVTTGVGDDFETLTGLNNSLVTKNQYYVARDMRTVVEYDVTGDASFSYKHLNSTVSREFSKNQIRQYIPDNGGAERWVARDKFGTESVIDKGSLRVNIGASPVEVPTLPKFDQLGMPRTYRANEPIKIPAPGSLPFTKTDTGEELLPYPKPDGTTGFKTRTGVEVPEDNASVGNPVKITNPDGSTTIKKAPSVATPNPSPAEDGKVTPKDDEITETDLEGLSCTRLKKPDFRPLTNAFTTSFPFSIPWDLQRLFQSAFAEIGSDEPSFEYKFEFNGKPKTWKIEFPDYFADWTKFVRPLLLIIFDIGLIYAIYRFTKGSD